MEGTNELSGCIKKTKVRATNKRLRAVICVLSLAAQHSFLGAFAEMHSRMHRTRGEMSARGRSTLAALPLTAPHKLDEIGVSASLLTTPLAHPSATLLRKRTALSDDPVPPCNFGSPSKIGRCSAADAPAQRARIIKTPDPPAFAASCADGQDVIGHPTIQAPALHQDVPALDSGRKLTANLMPTAMLASEHLMLAPHPKRNVIDQSPVSDGEAKEALTTTKTSVKEHRENQDLRVRARTVEEMRQALEQQATALRKFREVMEQTVRSKEEEACRAQTTIQKLAAEVQFRRNDTLTLRTNLGECFHSSHVLCLNFVVSHINISQPAERHVELKHATPQSKATAAERNVEAN